MIGLTGWIELITVALKFPTAVMELIKILKATPEEKHQDLLEAAQKESDKFKETGRPSWD